MKRLSTPYQLMLLAFVALAVYYPTQFAEISLVDDVDVIGSLLGAERISLMDIFFPNCSQGGYYRPLIGVSYWLDRHLWFYESRPMHFEGVLFHLLNGILLFFVCREALRLYLGDNRSYTPLAASLLFTLHPIVTESVNWVSGRTDIMMGNFVLLSVLMLLRSRRSLPLPHIALAVGFAFIAMLAKEAAFGWLLGMPLFFMYRPENAEVSETPKTDNIRSELYLFAAYYGAAFFAALLFRSFWLVLAISASYLLHTLIRMKGCTVDNAIPRGVRRRLILILISLALMATLFLIVRRIVFISDIRRIGQTISLMGEDLNYSFSMFLGAAGFYMKKFLVPFPLNFFIREIDPLYDFLGIAALLAALRCFVSTRLPANFVLSGFFVMLPALPFVFGTIAWTAYAERYIYLATAFWIVALSLWTGRWMNLSPKRIPFITGCVVILCLAMAGVTFSRNLVWLTNVDLMADTVAKNPQRRILRDIYMYSLLAAGRLEEAKREYGISRSIHDTFYDDKADLVMGNELNREGRSKEALRLYQDAIERSKYRSEGLLAAGIEQVRKVREAGPISAEERRHLSELELEYEGRLLEITRTPQRLIEAGRRASQRGAACEASSLFDEALHKLSRHERLYPVAESLLKETRN